MFLLGDIRLCSFIFEDKGPTFDVYAAYVCIEGGNLGKTYFIWGFSDCGDGDGWFSITYFGI